jgi:RyR domain
MSHYVKIITPEKLSKESFLLWFDTVEDNLPSGMVAQTAITKGEKTAYTRFYTKRNSHGHWAYIVPLVRDLDASEVHNLLQAWCVAYPTGDFLFDYSQPTESIEQPVTDLDQNRVQQALQAWAKSQHQQWMDEQLERGWHYGVKLSVNNKTHPWLQPWESLPPVAQEQKLSSVRDLLKILKTFGYSLQARTTV